MNARMVHLPEPYSSNTLDPLLLLSADFTAVSQPVSTVLDLQHPVALYRDASVLKMRRFVRMWPCEHVYMCVGKRM